jgi:hypothetical protein
MLKNSQEAGREGAAALAGRRQTAKRPGSTSNEKAAGAFAADIRAQHSIADGRGRNGTTRRAGNSCSLQAGKGHNREEVHMANLALVYGVRLLPAEELSEVRDATLVLRGGKETRVTMHLIEGSKEEIEKMLRASLDAYFEMYPEI